MVSWESWENSAVPVRRVQCPMCGHAFDSRRKFCQCSSSDCRLRFVGDDYLYKTDIDRKKERTEMDKKLDNLEKELHSFYNQTSYIIKKIRQELKPLDPYERLSEEKSNVSAVTQ